MPERGMTGTVSVCNSLCLELTLIGRYFDRVRKIVPPERRLEYNIGDGWEPLCAFLGKEVPNVPFPRLNERKVHERNTSLRSHAVLVNSASRIVPWLLATAAVGAAAWHVRRY